MKNTTVVFSLWGDWCKEYRNLYVSKLLTMINRHLSIPHTFVAFTDKQIGPLGIEKRIIPDSVLKWGLNLPKFFVHSPDAGLEGRVLYFDLDMIICGSIDEMAFFDVDFCGIKPFKAGNTHMGGGLLSFVANSGTSAYVWEQVSQNPVKWRNQTEGGKERLVLKRLLKQKTYWQDNFPGQLISFKKHLKKGSIMPDDNVRIIAFHGNPRPHTIMDNQVVREYWR